MAITVTDVRAHPGDSAFLVDDGVTAVLYDSGFGFTGDRVARNICAVLGDRPLSMILLTHSHYDHALGSVHVAEHYPQAQIVAADYAAKIFTKPSARKVMADLDRKFAARCGIFDYADRTGDLRVDIPVSDGDKVRAGDMEFTVVALPGHTKCSVGYYLASHALLLSCETLGVYDGKETIVPSCLVGYEMTLASIEKARALDIRQILLPHHGLLGPEETAYYLSHCRDAAVTTAEAIRGILRKGGTREDAVRYYADTFYHGDICQRYPEDAMLLNTGIMVDLLARENP